MSPSPWPMLVRYSTRVASRVSTRAGQPLLETLSDGVWPVLTVPPTTSTGRGTLAYSNRYCSGTNSRTFSLPRA